MFDWENAIALDTMQGNRASSRREGKVSWVFSSCGRKLGYILELQRGINSRCDQLGTGQWTSHPEALSPIRVYIHVTVISVRGIDSLGLSSK